MISIKLYNPKSGETNYYEQQHISFGELKSVLKFNKTQSEDAAELKILNAKLDAGKLLTSAEEKKYVDLSGKDDVYLEMLETLVAKLFKNPKVTVESIDEGLSAEGMTTLKDILADAMGGIDADENHPAKK
ncbi:phage tail assembly chaperone G [Companilactobacillus muriivasis]|uniref:phage tail assembly chaperone G n=1 Tax=Companilactobacillus muriivasis TaxID=3081444 RepID=UPI0030C77AD6